ncbi:hypothetical protein Nhal_1322 [Nitrosococcus halophilus Nc 4]|uniref:Uncharacterized protein n=1 Tax=Nitrosococcus halophilus (strain Nc4) TaxID=472759 RepID=D5C0E8_NITHN|nr:hypothetical protein Nhal_1322 [Nitrosococcus halophilus Nc 4]
MIVVTGGAGFIGSNIVNGLMDGRKRFLEFISKPWGAACLPW